jgi:signal transduction histidine kinase
MVRSLKRRLTAIVISIFIASWLLSALATSLAARVVVHREIDRVLESVLLLAESTANSLSGDLQPLRKIYERNMVPVDTVTSPPAVHSSNQPQLVRLHQNLYAGGLGIPSVNTWFTTMQLLVGENTPPFPYPRDAISEGEAINVKIKGHDWRIIYRRSGDHKIWLAAGIESQKAQLDGTQLLLRMLLPLAVLIPLTALALYYGVARGLVPLRRLANEIRQRQNAASLAALSTGNAPLELVPVVESLNQLLARLADTLENEKRFTANAAHELQTPLAAINAEVQLCQRLLSDDASQAMMERIRVRVERASHSVRQLLTLARLDPHDSLTMDPQSLPDMIREVASELGHIASERRLELVLDIDAHQTVQANREALLILLRNTLSNAFRYTPTAGTVYIAIDTATLTLENDAAPIDEVDRLTDRFYRGADINEGLAPGAGLGLSIVKRICELQGIELSLRYDDARQRFVVTLHFPC